ncbi:MAG: cadherin domain-containing protein [Bradyrhizobium sp.]|nr:cadherin domain-containing protein [Bradyrhizobium sp.]
MANSVPAFTFNGITRPALNFDNAGNIILEPAAAAFMAAYGLKALYWGLPANTPVPPVMPTLTTPSDVNGAVNSVAEGAAVNTPVGLTVQATNLSGTPVTYALTADSSGGAFKIDATTGVVTVANGALLNFESSTGHTVTVQATSGSLTTSQTFTIGVADINDNAPVFGSGSGANAADTPENVATTTPVYTAQATDADGTAANSTVTYSLAAGGDNDLFNINAVTGAVTFKVSPDADNPQDADLDNVYDITVTASDGLPAHNVSRNVSITVMNVNEAPVIGSNGGGDTTSINVDEGATAVTTVTATDPDVPAQALSFSVLNGASSPDGAKFSIDGSGNLTFIAAPDFEAFGSAAGNNTYVVQVRVTDNGSPALNDIQTITVNVADLNESTPVITSLATIAVDENLAEGAHVASVIADDDDGSAPNNALTYTVTGGSGQTLFDLDPTTGEVTLRNGAVLDRETAPSYTLNINVADGGTPSLFTTQTLTINLNDLNDNTPAITSPVAMAVDENAVGGTLVGTVTAADGDATAANNILSYTAVGGTGTALFDIDPVTGAITVHAGAVLDRETAASYTLNVEIADNGTPGLSAIETIQINLNDINEFTPTITSAATMSVDEGSAGGTPVGTVTATDGDATAPNNAISYAATGGTGFGLFDVTPATGAVTVKVGAVLNFEATPNYTLDVTATDGGALVDTQTLTINLNNLAPVFAVPPDSNASTNQTYNGAPTGSSTGIDAAANDPAGGTITYSLLDTLGDRFQINPATGVVTVGTAPIVFDTVTPANNTVTVTVLATDAGGLSTDRDYTIVILAELPPEVTGGNNLSYTENQGAAVIDAALTVTDANSATLTGATVQITANYVQGEDILAFANTPNITATFNPANGMLTLVGIDTVANYQAALRTVTYTNTSDNPSAAQRDVTFKANDGTVEGGAIDTINVTPVNDAPSIGANHVLVYTENQAATAIDPALTLIDLDNADITGAVVQITGNYVNGQDILAFVDTPNITGVFDAPSGTMTLSGTDTRASYEAALRAITYFNTSNDPSTLSRTLTITATDGVATSTPVTDTIIVSAVDDAPVVVAGHTLSYTEGDAATAIDGLVTVSDADSTNLISATVQITGNYADGQDTLAFTSQFGITGSFNPTTGTLSLSGNATVAQYQTVLQSVTYANSSTNPSTLDRTVTITTSDGNSSSSPATATIQVAAVNSQPDLQPDAPPAVGYIENAATATAMLASGTVVDPDAPLNFALGSFTVEITPPVPTGDQIVLLTSSAFAVSGTSLLHNGDLVGTISGLGTGSVSVTNLTAIATPAVVNLLARAFGLQNTAETPASGPRSVTFAFHDGGNTGSGGELSNSVTQTVNVTAVNDAPVNTAPAALQLTDTANDLIITGLSVSDVDSGGNTVTTVLHVTNGTLTVLSAGGAAVSGSNTDTVTLTGSVAQINTTLAAVGNIVYHPGAPGSDTLTITTNDGGHTGDDPSTVGQPDTGNATSEEDVDAVSILVTAAPVAGAPALDLDDSAGGTGYSASFTEGGAAVPIADTDASIIDAVAPDTIALVTIAITNHQPGDLLAANGALPGSIIASIYNPATGVLTLSGAGTLAEYAAALRQIEFSNGTDNPVAGNRSIAVVVNDGANDSNVAIASIQVIANNDAPVVDLDGGGGPVDFATNYVSSGSFIAIAAGTATVTDADNATLASATVVLTNAQTDDVLAISGALPGGITANIVTTTVPDQITVTLTGPASATDFEAALKQVVFANSGTTPDLTPRVVTVTVSDGTANSAIATTTITVTANSAPVANDDAAAATEAGGINNAVAGSNPSGNVITDVGGADTDAQDGPAGLTVVAVKTGPESTPVTTGVVGTALQGTYGKLTLNANGSYSYALDNNNATVQGLTSVSPAILDVFNYTINDSGGASDTATLTITITGADDLPQAVADVRTVTEDAAPSTFSVLANDASDPDTGALNTISTGIVTATGPGGTSIDAADVTVELVNGNTEIKVTLGPDFQQLTGSETATITIPYTLTGNGAETSTANLVITVNGVNDLPVAVNDTATMSENDAATTFPSVLGNDTLDKDHGALNTITVTPGTATASGPAGTGIDGGDVTVTVIGGSQIQIALGADFQRLQQGQTATIDVPYTLHGDGVDASSATFQVTVSGANDAPVVTAGAGATFTENGAAVSIAGSLTLTDIDNTTMSGAVVTLTNAQAGDVLSVEGQGASGNLASGVHFEVDNVAHTVNFSAVDSVADYQAALRLVQFSNAAENPSATQRSFTIEANDGEAASNIGSATASLTVVANNDAPVNTVPADNAVPTAFSNTNTPISGISVTDVDSGSGIITTQLTVAHGTLTVTLAGGASISAGANGSASLTLSGSVDAINATLANNVTYRSTDGYLGQDDLVVVTNDLGLTGNPGPLSDSDTVHIGVVPQVWFIDNTNSGPGNGAGTSADPFHSIAAFNASAGPGVNDYIVLRTGTGTYSGDGLNLQDGQQLYGAGETLQFQNPVTLETITIPNAGARPTINVTTNGDQGIDIAANNTIKGVNITTAANTTGLDDGNNSVGALTVERVAISGAGQAVDIDQGGALTVTLESVSSSGGAQGIQLAGGLTGNFNVSGNLNITNSATTGIDINGNTGSYTFSGASKVVSTGTHTAVSLNNAGTVSFTGGGLDIDTTTATGFSATGGTINITGAGNSVTSTTGQVLGWSGVSVGASGVTFGSLGATGTVANTAISLNNVDGNSFSGGNVTIAGTSGGASDGIRIEGGSSTNFSFGTTVIDNAGNDGIELSGANGTVTFSSVDIDGVAASGLNIAGNTNAITVSAGSIGSTNDPAGNAVDIAGGDGNISVAASVTKNSAGGDVVEITGRTGGTVTFSGAISASGGAGGIDIDANTGGTINFTGQTTLDTGAGNGVDLTGNTGATINFNAGGNGLDITTSTGTGFNATGGGTVNVQGTGNSINSSSATALNVVNTTIGASNLTFQSISSGNNTAAADPVSGIILNNTGSSGGLTVTGTGTTDGSGGTIQNTTGRGASLINTSNVSLNNMNFTNAGTTDLDATNGGLSTGDNLDTNAAIHLQNVTTVTIDNVNINGGAEQGINGNTVANFNLLNSSIENVGNAADEDGIHFYNMSGTSSIINTTINSSFDDNLNLQTTSGNLDLTISGGSATNSDQGSGYLFGIRGTTVANINIDGTSSTNNFSGGIVADAFDAATMNLRVNGSTSSGNNDQLSVSAGDNSRVDLEATGNTLSSVAAGDFVVIGLLGSAFDTGYVFDARIHGNTITVGNNLTADGVLVFNAGGGVINTAITNNTISYGGSQRAIIIQQGQDGPATTRATITGNNIDIPIDGVSNATRAIEASSGVADPSGAGSFLDLNIGGAGALANTITHSLGGSLGAGGDIRVRQRFSDNINLDGYVGGATDTAAVVAYLNARNNEVDPASASVATGTFSGNASPTFITVSVSTPSVLEDGATNLVFTLTRSGSTASSLVANFAITGAASAVSDFTVTGATTFTAGTGLGTVTFAAGSATAIITVDPTVDNDATEFDESVVLDVGNSATANGSFARAMIVDDAPLLAADGGIQASTPTPGVTQLTQSQLNSVVAAAIAKWADAGATAAQLAALSAITFTVADLAGRVIGVERAGQIVIDIDAAGHGWFVDATPNDNFEFNFAANAGGTHLFTNPANSAAGHLDLLTAVMHEMGHELGLPDLTAADDAHHLMYIGLVDGERRLPDAADLPLTNVVQSQAPINVVQAQAPLLPVIHGSAGNDTLNAGQGGNILVGLAGADNFVFANVPASASAPLTHVADYSFAEGDRFDFSALTPAFHVKHDSMVVRAVEDAGGTFAILQVNTGALEKAPNWVDVARLDGLNAGDAVDVLIDNHGVHLAHLHVGLLT